jgi:hypothetical protein
MAKVIQTKKQKQTFGKRREGKHSKRSGPKVKNTKPYRSQGK